MIVHVDSFKKYRNVDSKTVNGAGDWEEMCERKRTGSLGRMEEGILFLFYVKRKIELMHKLFTALSSVLVKSIFI